MGRLMPRRPRLVGGCVAGGACLALAVAAGTGWGAAPPRLSAWNDVGLHEMEASYSVYAVQPPGNNLRAQLVDAGGRLVRQAGDISLTYEALADPSGSINSTSIGKTAFWSAVQALYGRQPAADTGLSGQSMPGTANAPQPMRFDAARNGWLAEGIPITRIDDAGKVNAFPMLRVTARNGAGAEIAHADVVVPVSDEMACRACHGSNTMGAARPEDGWVNDPDPERDYRLNVLRRHDDRHINDAAYSAGLAANGYLAAGLYETVVTAKQPVLCTKCHAGDGPGAPGRADTSALTRAMHFRHATVADPATGRSLNSATDRSACYNCHPGAVTQHLRGAMGHAVALDGSLAIQCQSCHGNMQALGSRDRKGWQDLPDCQSCHTGHATKNAGALRYTTAFTENGQVRAAADPLFATNPDVPAAGLSLYRESTGHGRLACAACHGTAHAEYPSRGGNDNVQPLQAQGHGGTITDCAACHPAAMNTVTGGPHTMHPVTQEWARRHGDPAERGLEGCRMCHGADDRGTVLSRALGERKFQIFGQPVTYWPGYEIGCYTCHDGPRTEHRSDNHPPAVQDAALTTDVGQPVATDLQASDADGNALTLRIVRQPEHGTVARTDRRATYHPQAGYAGADAFTFAASDGSADSNLGTIRIQVGDPNLPPTATATALPTLAVTATPTSPATATPTDLPPRTPAPGETWLWLPWLGRARP